MPLNNLVLQSQHKIEHHIEGYYSVYVGIIPWLLKEKDSRHSVGTLYMILMTLIGTLLIRFYSYTSMKLNKLRYHLLILEINQQFRNSLHGKQSDIWFLKLLMVEELLMNGIVGYWMFMLTNISIKLWSLKKNIV